MPALRAVKLALAGLLLDQAASLALVRWMPEAVHSHPYFPWGQPPYNWLGGLACLLLLVVVSRPSRYYLQALPFLAAGLISNGLTYLWHGYYVDYLPTGLSYTNTADLIILAGCTWLLVGLLPSSSWRWRQRS
jgi:hypothetical protein